MAKIVIQHEVDPSIGMVLEELSEGVPGRAHGVYGSCTECPAVLHAWTRDIGIILATRHVDAHESSL